MRLTGGSDWTNIMTETEILVRCVAIEFTPEGDDMVVIRDAAAGGQELYLAVWAATWCRKRLALRRQWLLKAACGADDPAFVEAVEARQRMWLDAWHLLNQEPPPPVDVYHLTAKGGVVTGQILKRPPPSVTAGVGASRKFSTKGAHGLGRVGLRSGLKIQSGLDVARGRS